MSKLIDRAIVCISFDADEYRLPINVSDLLPFILELPGMVLNVILSDAEL